MSPIVTLCGLVYINWVFFLSFPGVTNFSRYKKTSNQQFSQNFYNKFIQQTWNIGAQIVLQNNSFINPMKSVWLNSISIQFKHSTLLNLRVQCRINSCGMIPEPRYTVWPQPVVTIASRPRFPYGDEVISRKQSIKNPITHSVTGSIKLKSHRSLETVLRCVYLCENFEELKVELNQQFFIAQ